MANRARASHILVKTEEQAKEILARIQKGENFGKLAEEFSMKSEKANSTFQIWLAHSFNGLIALQQKEYKKAISEFEKSNMQNPQTFYYLSMAYSKDGNTIEAKKFANKCANFNALININQSFVRNKAKEMSASL